MIELLKFGAVAIVLIGLMKGISYSCNALARKTRINPKLLTGIIAFLIFVICSILWNFTDIYQRLSVLTGVAVEK
jgi:hypothetical protein